MNYFELDMVEYNLQFKMIRSLRIASVSHDESERKKNIKKYIKIILMCERRDRNGDGNGERERERAKDINRDRRLINSFFCQCSTFAQYNEAIITLQGFARKIPLRHHCAARGGQSEAKSEREVARRTRSSLFLLTDGRAGMPAARGGWKRGEKGKGERVGERLCRDRVGV